ncbi:MAG TPA: hypothetical protein VLM11_08995 [Streptosporangiaceae bacterium]|nr:hypothetical protein [Streptosporangiaceae bacterium]
MPDMVHFDDPDLVVLQTRRNERTRLPGSTGRRYGVAYNTGNSGAATRQQ